MNKQYKPKEIEERIYKSWEKTQSFLAKESTSKFSILSGQITSIIIMMSNKLSWL